jgi:hypothetical protein
LTPQTAEKLAKRVKWQFFPSRLPSKTFAFRAFLREKIHHDMHFV